MDRRESLRILAWSTLTSGVLLEACKAEDKKNPLADEKQPDIDRMVEEEAHYKKISGEQFFTREEMASLALLSDIIIPKDEVSGSATEAGVPDFIEFIVKDMPQHAVPMRGGLRWLDLQSVQRFGQPFADASDAQRIEIVEDIAYPDRVKAGMGPGVAFFNLMRNLTATGFYTSEIGIRDIGYVGNQPNKWNGVPPEVLKQYGLAYSAWEEENCARYS